MSIQSDYLEFLKYEQTIDERINWNIGKYKYVGERGKGYEVIQSIFYEINKLSNLSNKQIRWYSVIINLVRHFRDERTGDIFQDLPAPGFAVTEGFKTTTGIDKTKTAALPVPPYIGLLESYVTEIAGMGTLVSAKQEISGGYTNYKLDRIGSLLTSLLKEMNAETKSETWEETFILTIKNAADNVIKFFKTEKGKNPFMESINTDTYKELILKRIAGIDKQRLSGYYNMEAFWNGFIP
jgi:hypothetical protein